MKHNDEKRFIRVYEQSGWTASHQIWVDRETGVQYLTLTVSQGGGVTPLIGADGKPLLYEETANADANENE